MKTLAHCLLVGAFLFCFEYTHAQSAARSSKETATIETDNNTVSTSQADTIVSIPNRGIPTPPLVEKLFQEGKVAEALNEFEKFKTTQKKADSYHLLYCEMTIYQRAQWDVPNNTQYAQKAEALRQELIEKYPNISDTYLLQIDENTPDDKVVELATKAIELDSENISAYEYRGRALLRLNQIKEGCADFDKLPWKNNLPEYRNCNNLK